MKYKILITIAIFGAVTLCGTSCGTGGNKSSNNSNKAKEEQSSMVQHLTKAEFLTKIANYQESPNEWKYLGTKPAIIDFYASWCGPCKTVAPILEELAKEYEGKIEIYKVDTEKEQELSAAFGIRSIPTFLFIPVNGQPQMAQGALPKSEFKNLIDKVLLK